MRFNWTVSSHVMEHVPDPIGWLSEIFEVLKPGAVLSLALPDKKFCFDVLSRSVAYSGVVGQSPFEIAECFEDAARHYY